MKLDDVFTSKYLKASDLPEEGTTTVTIEKVEMADIGMEKQRKPVITFEEMDKSLVCNKTNCNSIAKVTGSRDTDNWVGKQIRLFRTEVEFQGDMVEAIRVSIKAAKSTDATEEKGNW